MKPVKTIEKLNDGNTVSIAAIGDSLTYGWMVSKGYVDCFAEMVRQKFPDCNLNILNKGIPGDTARGGLYRLHDDVIKHDPDAVLVQFGLNDAFTGYSKEQYKHDIKSIIDRLTEHTHAEIILVSSVCLIDPVQDSMITEYYDILDELANIYNISIAKVHEYWRRKLSENFYINDLLQFDGVHPNDDGHRLMAEAVMELF